MNCETTPKKSNILSYPTLLSIYIFTALSLSASASLAQQSPAAGSNTSASTELRRYNIPAQPLSKALIEFGKQSGLQITTGSVLVEGKQAPSVSGTLSAEQALNQLLAGNDLRYEVNGGMVRLAADTETTALPSVRIGAQSLGMTDLPPAYAGGQVARGARIGLLGNRDIFDTPFSVTGYTAELIENQQAITVGDVIHNDPSARLISPGGQTEFQTITIRGFNIGSAGAGLYDGLPNLTNIGRSTVRTLERVEVFKGSNALLTGAIGGVGGVLNLVPKRPAKTSMTKLTTDYSYKSRLGVYADLSRRFGSKRQFGARLNTVYQKGESAIEDSKTQLGEVALALEYRGDKLKLETLLYYDERDLDRSRQIFIANPGVTSIPSTPDVEDSIQQPWEKSAVKFARALLKVEYDIIKDWTLHAAYGATDSNEYILNTVGLNLDTNGNFNALVLHRSVTAERYTWVAGIRGQFETGEITHQFSLDTMRSGREVGFSNSVNIPNSRFTSNLFNPLFITRPVLNRIPRSNLPKVFDGIQSSIAIANTMGFLDERILLTAGIRRQNIESKNFNAKGILTRKYGKSANAPAVGLVVKPWSFMSIYGNYIEALEQGVTAPSTAINAGEVFPPTAAEQIEFGMKFDLNGLGLTAGVFQIERPSRITENRRFTMDGEQRNRGLELNVFGELRPNLRLLGGITYIDSELTRTQGGRFDGNDAPGVPKLAAVLNLEWDATVLPGLTLTARAEHDGKKYVRSDNTVDIPSYELYGIGARYKRTIGDQQFTLRMNIDNLLNKKYWSNGTVDNILHLGAPRRIILSVSMDF